MIAESSIGGKISRKRTAVRYWIPIGIFACAFLFLIATMNRFVNAYDEGVIPVGSTRVLSGDIPYRDFYTNYGPAQFYVLAALFKAFSPSVLVERLCDFLIRSCVVLVIYLIVDGLWSRGRAIFLAFLTAIWLSYFENYGYSVFPCLLFSLLSLYCLIPLYQGSRAIAPLLASGICVGVTILFRHDVGIAAAVGGVFTVGLFHIAQKLDTPCKIKAMLRSAMIYAGGIALASVPPFVMLLAAGAAHDMLVDLVLIPAKTYVRMRSLPFPSVAELLREIIHLEYRRRGWDEPTPAVYLPVLGVLSGVLTTATLFARNRQSATSVGDQQQTSQRLWILVQLSVLSLLFFFKGWVRPNATHMALAIVPSLVIITVSQIEVRFRVGKILSATGIACLLLASVPPMWKALVHFALNLAGAVDVKALPNGVFDFARSGDGGCFPPLGVERLRCFYISKDKVKAIRYVQEHTSENDTIFLGSNRHDKIYVNDILFYFLAQRRPITKWHQFDPGVQTTIEVQSEMVGELQMRRPQYLVLSSEWDNVEEPNESNRSSGVTVLDQYIRRNYRSVAAFGPMTILQRLPN